MCEKAGEKVIEEFEFIKNGKCFQIFLDNVKNSKIQTFQENVFSRGSIFRAQRRI